MIVVADTSILINLCCVGKVDLLQSLFHQVVIPLAVADEFRNLAAREKRFAGLEIPDWVRQQDPHTISLSIRDMPGLHVGERAALALALEVSADAILLDEREAHAAAVQLGLRTFGLLAVLLQAKAAGLLVNVAPILDALKDTSGFWIYAFYAVNHGLRAPKISAPLRLCVKIPLRFRCASALKSPLSFPSPLSALLNREPLGFHPAVLVAIGPERFIPAASQHFKSGRVNGVAIDKYPLDLAGPGLAKLCCLE